MSIETENGKAEIMEPYIIGRNYPLVWERRIYGLPTYFISGRKKIGTGWNQYVGAHRMIKGKIKKTCEQYILREFNSIPKMKYIETFWSYGGTIRMDMDNKHSFWRKMFQDALVKGGLLSEDTKKQSNWCTSGYNPGQSEDLIIQIYGKVVSNA